MSSKYSKQQQPSKYHSNFIGCPRRDSLEVEIRKSVLVMMPRNFEDSLLIPIFFE